MVQGILLNFSTWLASSLILCAGHNNNSISSSSSSSLNDITWSSKLIKYLNFLIHKSQSNPKIIYAFLYSTFKKAHKIVWKWAILFWNLFKFLHSKKDQCSLVSVQLHACHLAVNNHFQLPPCFYSASLMKNKNASSWYDTCSLLISPLDVTTINTGDNTWNITLILSWTLFSVNIMQVFMHLTYKHLPENTLAIFCRWPK